MAALFNWFGLKNENKGFEDLLSQAEQRKYEYESAKDDFMEKRMKTGPGGNYGYIFEESVRNQFPNPDIANYTDSATGGFLSPKNNNQVTDESVQTFIETGEGTAADANAALNFVKETEKQEKAKLLEKETISDAQKKQGGILPKEKEKQDGAFKSLWNKFTDKDSSAPRNLLDFGLAMMANSKGAGNDFLGTVAQSVGDTVDKADARKLLALETAKDNLAGKLERTKTISEIEDNIVDRYTSETEDMNGVKTSTTDWMKVSAAMDELDPDGDYFSKGYITEIAKNGFGMPALNEDGQYELEVPTDNNQAFKYFKQMEYIGMMNPDKEPKDIEIVVGNRIMSLQMIMDEQLKQMQG